MVMFFGTILFGKHHCKHNTTERIYRFFAAHTLYFSIVVFLSQTVAVLEERLTLTEDKLRMCLDNQALLLEQNRQADQSDEERESEGPFV